MFITVLGKSLLNYPLTDEFLKFLYRENSHITMECGKRSQKQILPQFTPSCSINKVSPKLKYFEEDEDLTLWHCKHCQTSTTTSPPLAAPMAHARHCSKGRRALSSVLHQLKWSAGHRNQVKHITFPAHSGNILNAAPLPLFLRTLVLPYPCKQNLM